MAIVVVPNHLHYPVAKDSLQAEVHCLLEKPFAERLLDTLQETVVEGKEAPTSGGNNLATYNAFLDGEVTEKEKELIMGVNIIRLFGLGK